MAGFRISKEQVQAAEKAKKAEQLQEALRNAAQATVPIAPALDLAPMQITPGQLTNFTEGEMLRTPLEGYKDWGNMLSADRIGAYESRNRGIQDLINADMNAKQNVNRLYREGTQAPAPAIIPAVVPGKGTYDGPRGPSVPYFDNYR